MNETMLDRAGTSVSTRGAAWSASLIKPLADKGVGTRASFVRKTFALAKAPTGATLRISAFGLFRAFINGQRVGDDLLTPGWTSYDKRLSFLTYDVSALLKAGDNTIDIWLADGWFRSQLMWARNPLINTYGDEIGAIAELSVGGEVVVKTDKSWKSGLVACTRVRLGTLLPTATARSTSRYEPQCCKGNVCRWEWGRV